ncbi:CGI-121-domain-containing protein [Periconia macrospinosa]|uniref:EKC/KEOPS complex subunit CGI121 n=1 Tax=Periconia macrospinosa TaxID=97972 RepID=A0A2V1E417_9PLEO|nr:CGI-121-domain-containing protein [Periconia macrospinosa]
MAQVRTILLPHFEDYPVQVAMFKDVTNASFLRSQLLQANPDFDYAFLDAAMILSPLPLFLAITLSLHSTLSPATSPLRTRTPHSELVFRLHPNNNIGESYRKFGISDDTTNLIAVKFSLTPDVTNESVAKHLSEAVQGVSVDVGEDGSELGLFADLSKIKKIYKVNDGGVKGKGGKKGVTDQVGTVKDERSALENIIMGVMTLKGS